MNYPDTGETEYMSLKTCDIFHESPFEKDWAAHLKRTESAFHPVSYTTSHPGNHSFRGPTQYPSYPPTHSWYPPPHPGELSLRATAMVDPTPRLQYPQCHQMNVATTPGDFTPRPLPTYSEHTGTPLTTCDYIQPTSNSHLYSSPSPNESYAALRSPPYFYGHTSRKIEKCRCPNCIEAEKTGTKKTLHVCSVAGCAKVYKKTSHLKAHIRSHNGIRPFRCTWFGCAKSFTRSDELLRHHRIHTGTKNFTCHICGKQFVRSDHYKKHVNTHKKAAPMPNEENIDVLND
uniref:Zinc finger transcription factor Sp5 n=1 Tax=Stylopallene sp. Stylo_038458_TRINITY_DN28511_c TaxID=2138381 RepID=A0A2R4FYD2_9CHEL|nr:zinc finger transcription factor Sp5 [Stylopallene sp. Stylo_038458_TRINITY_DN28511_c]